ncbi:hypothetical protein HYV81_00360 [Candidatus Woesearchaeota archaeon]|nr:hypothetical protein [Candidatus Woesearchaeota archaeon]
MFQISDLAKVARELADRPTIKRLFPIDSVDVKEINPAFPNGGEVHLKPSGYGPLIVRYHPRVREIDIFTVRGKIQEAFAERLQRAYAANFPAIGVTVVVREDQLDHSEGLSADMIRYA